MLKKLMKYGWFVWVGVIVAMVAAMILLRGISDERGDTLVTKFLEEQNYNVVDLNHFVNYTSVFCTRFDDSYPFVAQAPDGEHRGVVCVRKKAKVPRFGIDARYSAAEYPKVDLTTQ